MRKAALLVVLISLVINGHVLASEEVGSKEAYDQLLEELKVLEHSVSGNSSAENIMEIFDKIESKLLDFVEKYPHSSEALDAKFQLGMLNSNISQYEKAKKYLGEYIIADSELPRKKLAYAHFFVAEAYKNSEEYDKAKIYYHKLIGEFSDVDKVLISRAEKSLKDMDVLRKLHIGNPPIPFEVKDMEGKALSVKKCKGKVVLLDFWATWCGPCRREMPNVVKLYNKFHKKGFEIIGISLDNDKERLERYIKDRGIKWPQYFDGGGWRNSVAEKYRIRSIPATFLIDRDGKIRYKSVRGRRLEEAVEKLLREK